MDVFSNNYIYTLNNELYKEYSLRVNPKTKDSIDFRIFDAWLKVFNENPEKVSFDALDDMSDQIGKVCTSFEVLLLINFNPTNHDYLYQKMVRFITDECDHYNIVRLKRSMRLIRYSLTKITSLNFIVSLLLISRGSVDKRIPPEDYNKLFLDKFAPIKKVGEFDFKAFPNNPLPIDIIDYSEYYWLLFTHLNERHKISHVRTMAESYGWAKSNNISRTVQNIILTMLDQRADLINNSFDFLITE
jgi:hypothetical protein